MKIIGLILAIAMVSVSAWNINYAIYSCFGLTASVIYMIVVIIGLGWNETFLGIRRIINFKIQNL